MGSFCTLQRMDQIEAIADTHRLAILRTLMAQQATISQLGAQFGKHPAWVRYHVKKLESVGLLELSETRVTANYTEKFYRATAAAFSVNLMIAPQQEGRQSLVVLGSSDFAVDGLAKLANAHRDILVVPVSVGSLDGLIALRQGLADVAGCHLLDAATAEYNTPYVRHLFPDRPVVEITLSFREQGLIVAHGNPRGITGLEALADGIRLANRNTGSGTRVWLDHELRRLGLDPTRIAGYDRTLATHDAVADAIASGTADVGLGIRAAAERHDLHFIPLFHERYDLVLAEDRLDDLALQRFLDPLSTASFRNAIRDIPGYDAGHTGDLERVVA